MATPVSNDVPVTQIDFSGVNDIDALLGSRQWGTDTGAGVELPFSFPSGSASFANPYSPENEPGIDDPDIDWYALNGTQQAAFIDALASWSNVADIDFDSDPSDADIDPAPDNASTVGEIRVAFSDAVGMDAEPGSITLAWAYLPSIDPTAGDIWVNPAFRGDSFEPGSFLFATFLHEIGHALGLKHPFEEEASGAVLPDSLDNMFYTVMSYTEDPSGNDFFADRGPTTPMVLDIQAIQYLYGPNWSHNDGNDTYIYDEFGEYLETIWDGGGVDTIVDDGSLGVVIDLREGQWSTLGQPVRFTDSSDTFQYEDLRTVWIAHGTEIENAEGGSGGDLITGNALDNVLNGNAGDDDIEGGAGNDTLAGGSGDDTLEGGAGSDRLSGGTGNDRYVLIDNDVIVELPAEGMDTVALRFSAAFAGFSLEDYIERAVVESGAGSVFGNALDNLIEGGADDESLHGGAGDDTMFGGDGFDLLVGDDGNDVLSGNRYGDVILGGEGDDDLRGGGGFDYLHGNAGNDTLAGALGDDELRGGQGMDLLVGFSGADLLVGGHGDDTLDGGDGADELQGLAGTDELFGGDGADRLSGGDDDDVLDGGTGDDTLSGDGGNDTLFGDDGFDVLDGGAGNDVIFGNKFGDTIFGGAGDDSLRGSRGHDFVQGNEGADTLVGGLGNDELRGGQDPDSLRGSRGDDLLIGALGNDTLNGGTGDDELWGMDGGDTFVFDQAGDGIYSGRDTIMDFVVDEDIIHIAAFVNDTDIETVDDVLDRISPDGQGGSLIDLDSGNVIGLPGVDPASLAADDFAII